WASTARIAARPTLPVPHTAVRIGLGWSGGQTVASVTPGRYPPAGSADLLLAEPPAVGELRLQVVAVHHRDEVDRDLLRARFLALAVVGAGAEVLLHGLDHGLGPGQTLGSALRQQVEVLHLGGGEQVGRRVRARRHAGAATDAGRG